MIVQWLLDVLGEFLAGILDLIPDAPAVDSVISGIDAGIAGVAGTIEPLGVLVPFEALTFVAGAWIVVCGYWVGTLAFRVITFLAKS